MNSWPERRTGAAAVAHRVKTESDTRFVGVKTTTKDDKKQHATRRRENHDKRRQKATRGSSA